MKQMKPGAAMCAASGPAFSQPVTVLECEISRRSRTTEEFSVSALTGSKILEFDGSSWHEDCFVCHSCEKPIGGEAFVPNKNQYYCVPCYEDRFTPRCSHCNKVRSASLSRTAGLQLSPDMI